MTDRKILARAIALAMQFKERGMWNAAGDFVMSGAQIDEFARDCDKAADVCLSALRERGRTIVPIILLAALNSLEPAPEESAPSSPSAARPSGSR